MMLIDSIKLIEDLGLCGCYKHMNPEAYDTLMKYEILGAIEDQPTISQWIPVGERLPEEYEDVLVTLVCTENGGYTGVAMDCIAYDGKWFAHYNDNVVAWMPLPEPYKESITNEKIIKMALW